MGFEDLSAPQKTSTARGVKMSAQERKNGSVVIRLSIPVDKLEVIGKPTDRYKIQVGTGDHRGSLRLQKDKSGPFVPEVLKGTAVFYLGETEFAPDGRQKSTLLSWSPAGVSAIKITLPSWAFNPESDKISIAA